MTEIAAVTALNTAKIATLGYAQAAPKTEAAPVAPVEATPTPALVRNSVDPTARVVMDVRAGYEVGAAPNGTTTAARDFDRLAYVLEGFEHMRRVINPGVEAPAPIMAEAPEQPLFQMDITA